MFSDNSNKGHAYIWYASKQVEMKDCGVPMGKVLEHVHLQLVA